MNGPDKLAAKSLGAEVVCLENLQISTKKTGDFVYCAKTGKKGKCQSNPTSAPSFVAAVGCVTACVCVQFFACVCFAFCFVFFLIYGSLLQAKL